MSDEENSSSSGSSQSRDDPVQYEIDEDLDASILFEQGFEAIANGNKDLANRLFGAALEKFELEHQKEDQKRSPEFQYKWASCLRAAGAEFDSAESIILALAHYKAALHLIDNDPPSPKAKRAKPSEDGDVSADAKLRINILVGQAIASINLLTIRAKLAEDRDSDDDSDNDEPAEDRLSKPSEQERATGVATAIRAVTEAIASLSAAERASKLTSLAQALEQHATAYESNAAFGSATQQCKLALELHPDDDSVLIQLASVLLSHAKLLTNVPNPVFNTTALLTEAAKYLRQASKNPASFQHLGEVLLLLGSIVDDDEEAEAHVRDGVEAYQRAAEAFPDNADLAKLLAVITSVGEGEVEESD